MGKHFFSDIDFVISTILSNCTDLSGADFIDGYSRKGSHHWSCHVLA
tara:strand:+ start:45226 stop:45366 length:141 start_codon:yes stop_codon:yes gene_type:complete